MITDNELLDLIDGNLTSDKEKELRSVIENDPDLKARFELLTSVDMALIEQKELNPSISFTEMVMANLNKKLAPASIYHNGFWRKNLFVVGTIIVIVFFAGIMLLSIPSLSNVLPVVQPQDITIFERTINIDPGKITFFNQELFIKGLVYLNAFLLLFLLDRAVLRPYFKNKSQSYSL
jgi:hypothetical protein